MSTQDISVIIPPPFVVDVIIPSQGVTPQPPITVGPGVQGTTGIQGLQGLQGPIGITPTIALRYLQNTPSAVWTIQHNLGFYPNVTVEDSAGTIVEGEIAYPDSNNVVLTFSASFSGTAYLS